MERGVSFDRVVSRQEIDETGLDEDRYDPAMYAQALIATHVSSEVAAEQIVDAFELGLLTWEDATLVAREVKVQ